MNRDKTINRQPRWMPSRKQIADLLDAYKQSIPKLEQEMLIQTMDGVLSGKVIEAQWKPTGITMVIGAEPTWTITNANTPFENAVETWAYDATYRFFFDVRRNKKGEIYGKWKLSSKSHLQNKWHRDDLGAFGYNRMSFELLFDKTFDQWLFDVTSS